MSEVRERRAGGCTTRLRCPPSTSTSPISRWKIRPGGGTGGPCPIRAEDLARQKEIRSRKSLTHQRTREQLPVLLVFLARVHSARTTTAATASGSFPAAGRTLRRYRGRCHRTDLGRGSHDINTTMGYKAIYPDEGMGFCLDTRIWPTNNISDRDIGPNKSQQKISGTTRLRDHRLDIRSYLGTARKHGQNGSRNTP
ncbi:MAG: hypothetical protein ACRDTF_22335 [Pseudonocardiaceae bacterium]